VVKKRAALWWLVTRSFTSALVLVALWTVLFLLRLVEVIYDRSIDWLGWTLLILSALLIIFRVPSLIYFARLRDSRKIED
jgi:hypothetical protein